MVGRAAGCPSCEGAQDARRRDGRDPNVTAGRAPPLGHLLGGPAAPAPCDPHHPTPVLGGRLATRAHSPLLWPRAPWRPPPTLPVRPGRQAAVLPPSAARPLTCGGRPAGRGRGGAGQQQGKPPGQPILPGARAEQPRRRRERARRNRLCSLLSRARAPALRAAPIFSLLPSLLPSFPPARAPIPTFRPLPAPSASACSVFSPPSANPRSQRLGGLRDADTCRGKLGGRERHRVW